MSGKNLVSQMEAELLQVLQTEVATDVRNVFRSATDEIKPTHPVFIKLHYQIKIGFMWRNI